MRLRIGLSLAAQALNKLTPLGKRVLLLAKAFRPPKAAYDGSMSFCQPQGFEGKAVLHYSKKLHSSDCENPMTTLTVTARGQVTFRKDVLQHLGIRPGEKIELDLLPDGRGVLKAARPTATIAGFVGLLAGRTNKVATIEEINAASARGWAGKE